MTKIVAIIAALGILLTEVAAPAASREAMQRITESVYAYADVKNASPSNSFGANAGIIIGKDAVAVVDTLGTAKEARAMIAQIRRITTKPIRYVINTHFHYDHTLGNGAFDQLGAVVVAHERCRKFMITYGENLLAAAKRMGLTDEMLDGTTLSYPSVVFSRKAIIDLGEMPVELHFVAAGHSPDGIVVVVPKEKVVFTGDNLNTNFHAYLGTADMDGWQKNLDHILAQEATIIIPGHGPLSDQKDVVDMKTNLTLFDQKAKEMCAASDNLDEIVEQMQMVLPVKAQGDWMIRGSLKRKYFKPKP